MKILGIGALDKALEGPGKLYTEKLWKKIYEVIDDEYFKQLDIEIPEEFLLKCRQEYNISHFIPVDIKNSIQQIGLEYGLLSQIIKIKWTIIGETDTASKNKKKR